jgi:hypothetical protein
MQPIRIIVLFLLLVGPVHASETEGIEFFESHIRPIFVEHCYKCHAVSAEKLQAGLFLDSRHGVLTGGESGPAIVPGDPDQSRMLKAIEYRNHDFQMPPKYKLDEADIRHIREWIEMGAPDPRNEDRLGPVNREIDLEAGRQFWAFQPIQANTPPSVQDMQWPLSGIDQFILAKLEANELPPNGPAEPETLLRRVYFDLTGLPPTPEQIDEYLQAPSQENLARVVDDLLASESFGERWGRHWLDVARFAESSGGGRSLMFEHAWRFRDYVIESFNADKPFNEFIVEQIAGDLLLSESAEQYNERLIASGYLMLGPTNYELQDKELLRMEVIDEQIDTVGRSFLGMTLGCARCHDHKFDPIPAHDYYAMAGIFGSTQSLVPGNVSGFITQSLRPHGVGSAEMAEMEKANAEKVKLAKDLVQIEKKLEKPGTIQAKGVDPARFDGIVIDDHEATLVGAWTSSTFAGGFLGDRYVHDDGKGKGEKRAIFSPKITHGGLYEVRVSYTAGGNRATSVPVIIQHQDGRAERFIDQSTKPSIDGSFESVGTYRFEADTHVSVAIETTGTDAVVIADAVQFLPVDVEGGEGESENAEPLTSKATETAVPSKELDAEIAKLRKRQEELETELTSLRKQFPIEVMDVAMSVKDANEKLDSHLLIRGAVRNHGPLVPRGFLQVAMHPDQPAPKIPEDQSGRLQLAQWIASDENTLTSRVMVNRVWHHLFGSGIVRTTDNFGAMGERPSHPALLDHLAAEFVADGWSVKRLVRKLVLSKTYQLSSDPDRENSSADVENRLLWRANRKRLDAECIRDAMLLISGQLDSSRGGLTIQKIEQYDQNYKFDSRQRSVYVPCFRNSVLDLFEVFDMANPNMVTGRRTASVLPTQSLFMMNSPFVIDLAQHAAALWNEESAGGQARDIERLYRRILGRRPLPSELKLSRAYLNSFKADEEALAKESLCHSLIASIDFRTLY